MYWAPTRRKGIKTPLPPLVRPKITRISLMSSRDPTWGPLVGKATNSCRQEGWQLWRGDLTVTSQTSCPGKVGLCTGAQGGACVAEHDPDSLRCPLLKNCHAVQRSKLLVPLQPWAGWAWDSLWSMVNTPSYQRTWVPGTSLSRPGNLELTPVPSHWLRAAIPFSTEFLRGLKAKLRSYVGRLSALCN